MGLVLRCNRILLQTCISITKLQNPKYPTTPHEQSSLQSLATSGSLEASDGWQRVSALDKSYSSMMRSNSSMFSKLCEAVVQRRYTQENAIETAQEVR